MNKVWFVIPLLALALAGCSTSTPEVDTETLTEGGMSKQDIEQPTVLVDVVTSCDRGNRLYRYTDYKKGGLAVVPNDPSCLTENGVQRG